MQRQFGSAVSLVRDLALGLGRMSGGLLKLMEWPLYRRVIGSDNCAQAWRALGATIAPDAIVTRGVWMRGPENVTIAAGCHLHDVILDAWAEIVIEENVLINSAKLLTAGHDIDSPQLKGVRAPIRIGRYTWVIHDVVILQGVTVGECAVLATRSVVTKDVEPYAVVAGNPARVIRERARVDFEYVPSAGIVG